jgi:hypothetical protein
MASDTTTPTPPAAGSTAQAPSTPSSSDSLPDPFAAGPTQSSADGTPASASSADGSAASPSESSTSDSSPASAGGGAAPAPGGASAPQTGIWCDDLDPQFLIQWSLQEAQASQPAGQTASQAAPPNTSQARVRIFQEAFETDLTAVRPIVPFSLRDANTGSPYLQGSLVLLQQPSVPPVLMVKNLKFSGFQQAQVVLFPSTPEVPGTGTSDSGD